MAKSWFTLPALASVLLCVPAMGQTPGNLQPDLKASFLGSPLTCSQPEKVLISRSFEKRAKLKIRLLNLLRESLYDDSKGIVNVGREKEIEDLARKLREDKSR